MFGYLIPAAVGGLVVYGLARSRNKGSSSEDSTMHSSDPYGGRSDD